MKAKRKRVKLSAVWRRARVLLNEGITADAVVSRLNAEGFVKANGKPYRRNDVIVFIGRSKKSLRGYRRALLRKVKPTEATGAQTELDIKEDPEVTRRRIETASTIAEDQTTEEDRAALIAKVIACDYLDIETKTKATMRIASGELVKTKLESASLDNDILTLTSTDILDGSKGVVALDREGARLVLSMHDSVKAFLNSGN